MTRSVTCTFKMTVLLIGILFLLTGCPASDDSQSQNEQSSAALPGSLFLTEAPTGIASIADLKGSAQEGDVVVIKAVVGGRKNLFVANRAVVTVIDASVPNPCTAEGHSCPTPWDYCCTPADQLLPQMATVQILGDDGRPLALELSDTEAFAPLNNLVIQGTVGARDDASLLVIHATGVYVDAQS